MDIELLRTFLEVSRTRHFGQAAEILCLTPAAVSARIKSLERLLGVRLFDRVKREMRLTPEGNRLIRRADRLISEWRKIRQEISVGGASNQLSVGGVPQLWDVLLQDWLVRLRGAQPGLAMIVESLPPDLLTRRLLDGVLDLAFMLEPPQIELFQIWDIGGITLELATTRPDIEVEQALDEGFLMVDWGLAHSLQHRRRFPEAAEPRTRLANSAMALAYLREIGGTAYLPSSMLAAAQDEGWLYPVADAPRVEHRVHAVYALHGGRSELVDSVLSYFQATHSEQEE